MKIHVNIINKIVEKVILGQNYRIEIQNLINAEFLEYVVTFFQKVAEAKIKNKTIDIQWYKDVFLSINNTTDEIAIYSGLNKKSITNMYGSAKKQVVIDVANEHFNSLFALINELSSNNENIDLELNIRFRGISVHLNINESLLVINTIAVKRAAIRGSLWSSLGKNVEKKLMIVICKIFSISKHHYNIRNIDTREVDFYFIGKNKKYKCEIKLMGKGNPESADAVIARSSDIFIADTLSDLNKRQLESLDISWIELNTKNGYLKFNDVFGKIKIPHIPILSITSIQIQKILSNVDNEKTTI